MNLNNAQLNAEIRQLQLRLGRLSSSDGVVGALSGVAIPGGNVLGSLPAGDGTAPHSVVNQSRNGDLSHSVRTWFETTATDDDENKECAWWFCHDAPASLQQLSENTTKTGGTPNNALKFNTHSGYSATRADWDRPTGQARLNGTTTLDAPLPQNLATAGKTQYLVMIAARRNSYIILPASLRMFGGVWDNTAGQRDWLKANAAFAVSGGVTGTPASTVERRYKVFARTDRGFTFLSSELILTNAPAAGAFVPNTVYVALNFTIIPEILSYDVYRYTPSTGVYELLDQVTSGANTYNDQNSVLRTVSGYPAASDDRPKAYFATRAGELSNLAINGVSARWDTIALKIQIPSAYNQSLTTDKQWLRIGLTQAMDLQLPDGVTNGTTTVTSAAGEFQAAHVGMSVTVSDATHTLTTTIASVTNATTVVLTAAAAWSSAGNTIYVTGGGLRGILCDLIHCSYVDGAIYAPYFEDLNRPLPAAATPNGSSQGGTGTGGGGGGVRCVSETEKILVYRGNQKCQIAARDVRINDALASGNLTPNFVQKITTGRGEICLVQTKNGVSLKCTASHRLITSAWDVAGTPLKDLKPGDMVLTEINDKLVWSSVKSIRYTGRQENVITFAVTPAHLYMAGSFAPAGLWGGLKRLLYFLFLIKITASIASHNRKIDQFLTE